MLYRGPVPDPKTSTTLVVRLATNKISRLDILTNRAMEGDLISKEGSYESPISSSNHR
jgi:hypothetical protein